MLELNDGRSELWQWDTGRTLTVDPDCSQVHFSNKVFGRSIDVDVIDGEAAIPDILLQTDKDLNVWAFSGTAENGYTKISKTFKVNRRNKPADYVFTPVEQTTIDEIAAIAQSVRDDADAGLFDGKPGENGRDGVDGKDGAPGKDGTSATHSWNGTVLTITSASGTSSADLKGDKGDKGEQGIPGPAGSVDNLTAENIQSALGYTPADSADLADKLPKSPTDWEVWTAEERAAARERIAADGAWQCVTLTADDYDAENHRFLIDAGEGRQIAEVYGIGQVVTDKPADADLNVGIGFGNANKITYGAFGNYSIQATNTQTSFSFDGKSIDFTSVKSDTYSQFGTVKYNTSKYAASNFYVDANIGNAANVKSMIYWRDNNPRYFSIFGLWDNVTWAAIKIYIKLR